MARELEESEGKSWGLAGRGSKGLGGTKLAAWGQAR